MDEQPHIRRIETWIEMLEQKARALLDSIELDTEEMSPKMRIDCAVKLMALMQRYMVLHEQCEAKESPARSDAMLAALMRQMRGEVEDAEG